jgi:hypothetical protein
VEQCLLSPVGRDILATPGGGDLARFGVRLMVKVRPPPRGRIACRACDAGAELCRGLPLHLAHGRRHVRPRLAAGVRCADTVCMYRSPQ